MAMSDLRELGFPSTFTKSQFVQVLGEKYPDHRWEKVHLLRGRYAQQKRLERAVRQFFEVTLSLHAVSFANVLLVVVVVVVVGCCRDMI